jgi:hypothetical protein
MMLHQSSRGIMSLPSWSESRLVKLPSAGTLWGREGVNRAPPNDAGAQCWD